MTVRAGIYAAETNAAEIETIITERAKANEGRSLILKEDARHWRRFLSNSPPLDDLIEIRRLHDNKTILRRRSELPPSFLPGRAEWRPV